MLNSTLIELAVFALIICLSILAFAISIHPPKVKASSNKINKKLLTAALIVTFFQLLFLQDRQTFLGFIHWDGPYHGQVVDAETRKPIVGAAVAGLWKMENYFIKAISLWAGGGETETDVNGKFVLPRIWVVNSWPFARLEKMRLWVFKPGYDSHPPYLHTYWTRENEQERGMSKAKYHDKYFVQCQQNENCMVRLNKTSTAMEERLANCAFDIGLFPESQRHKIENFIKSTNNEKKKYGADIY